jgi:hypothetical protein
LDLTRSEVKAILFFAAFMAVWSFIVVPWFQGIIQSQENPDPLFWYPAFNLVYLVLFGFLAYSLLLALGYRGSSDVFWSAFRYGLAGFIILWMIPDIVAPPYLITREGELLTQHPLWPTVGDSFWYAVLSPHIPKEQIYAAVYFYVPIILFITAALIASPKLLAKLVREL